MYAITVALLCFFGDGHPLSDQCRDALFEPDVIFECRTIGSSVPLHINTGTQNPALGTVWWGYFEPETRNFVQLGHTAFESRGYSSFRPDNAAVYTVNGDLMFVDGMEECDAFVDGGMYFVTGDRMFVDGME